VRSEILVIGAGPVGATFALLANRFGARVRLLEAREGPSRETRTLALSHGSREILARAGAWAGCGGAAEIHRIHCSQQGGFGRALLDRRDAEVPALGYVLGYGALQAALDEALAREGIEVRYGARIAAIGDANVNAQVVLDCGETCTAGAVVLADGGANLSKLPRFSVAEKDYAQAALLAHVTTDRAHGNTAYERFTAEGPAALLPALGSCESSLVWVSAPSRIEELKALDETEFLAAFQQHFGFRAGRFVSVGARRSFPLKLRTVSPRAAGRIAVIGNAAQALHPVAGQGFNLGLRDALQLARSLAGGKIAATEALRAYAASREGDVERSVGFTDLLVGLFGNDHLPTRALRGAGLFALDVSPTARRQLARRMTYGARR
jgi:2-octaprenyl-6-methoxyphenol hydroxylase